MGAWTKLAGIGLAAAGVFTGNPALVGMGGAIVTGDIGAEASKDAAKTQTAAADKALTLNQNLYQGTAGLQRDVYNQSQAGLAPYQGIGSQAVGSLGTLMGYGPMALPPSLPSLSGPTSSSGPEGAVPRPNVLEGDAGGSRDGAVRRPTMQDPQVTAQIQTESAYGGRTLGSLAGMVTLRGPDGSTRTFLPGDPNMQKALQAGAEMVS